MDLISIVIIAGVLLGMAGIAQSNANKSRKKVRVRVKKD